MKKNSRKVYKIEKKIVQGVCMSEMEYLDHDSSYWEGLAFKAYQSVPSIFKRMKIAFMYLIKPKKYVIGSIFDTRVDKE